MKINIIKKAPAQNPQKREKTADGKFKVIVGSLIHANRDETRWAHTDQTTDDGGPCHISVCVY